ncbi:MAG TPA: DUF6266 family protein [Salinivirgaceae bacterium]|nr:DUF6266 family protein [Salinivirgaceae bacterium]
MAVINSVAVGAAKGKVGNIIYSRSAGRTIAREYQPSIKNPNTPEQQKQRSKMRNIIVVYNAISPALKHAFAGRKRTLSVFNAFVSANVSKMKDDADFELNSYPTAEGDLIIGNGNLGKTEFSKTGAGSVQIDFSKIKNRLSEGDKAMFFAYDFDTQELTMEVATLTAEQVEAGVVSQALATASNGMSGGYIYTAKGNKSSFDIIGADV